jgi:hypothetical protein
MSGKAMQGAIPQSETAFQEVIRRVEESGHSEVAASLLTGVKALPPPKYGDFVIPRTRFRKHMSRNGLRMGSPSLRLRF